MLKWVRHFLWFVVAMVIIIAAGLGGYERGRQQSWRELNDQVEARHDEMPLRDYEAMSEKQ